MIKLVCDSRYCITGDWKSESDLSEKLSAFKTEVKIYRTQHSDDQIERMEFLIKIFQKTLNQLQHPDGVGSKWKSKNPQSLFSTEKY